MEEDGWKARTDDTTGRTYWYNSKLRQTAWQKPDPNAGKGQWEERVDGKGETFYYNFVTKVRSYTVPEDYNPKARNETSDSNKKVGALESVDMTSMDRTSIAGRLSLGGRRTKRMSLRNSIKLGENLNAPPSEDKFSKLRALRNADQSTTKMRRESTKIDLDRMSAELPAQDEGFDYLDYAQDNFKMTLKGSILSKGKPIDLKSLTEWGSLPLRQSLHGMSHPTLEKLALLANKNIMGYMGDHTPKKATTATEQLYHTLKIGIIDSPEELRDEIFCQIIKQITNNPGETSCQKGWILMAICTGSFPPSQHFEPYLASYLERASTSQTYNATDVFAKYALLRLKKSIEVGPREEIPSSSEIDCISRRKPVPVSVYLVNGKELIFETETWTTVGDLKEKIKEALGIVDDVPFALMEVSIAEGDTERVLESDEKVLDVLAFWESERLAYQDVSKAPDNRFVYKIRLFIDISEEDTSALELAYFQATHDVTDSRYPVTELDLTRLIALEAQEKFGDYDGTDVFGDEFELYLPVKYANGGAKVTHLKDLVMERYQQLAGMDKLEAKKSYIDYVKEWKVYGAQSFFVEPQNNPAFPKLVILAINAHGALVIDPKSKDLKAEFDWKQIVTWGKSPENFCLVIGTYLQQTKLWFKPTTPDENDILYGLVEAYGEKLRRI